MKRKAAVMGLAMMAGLPQAVCAKGLGKMATSLDYASGSAAFDPHYGQEGSQFPLMDHLSMAGVLPPRDGAQGWQLGIAPPPVAYRADDPLMARDKRIGVTFKLDF